MTCSLSFWPCCCSNIAANMSCHRSRWILTRLLFNVLPFWMSRTQTLLKRIRVLRECQEVAWLDDCGLGFIVPLVFCLYSHPHVCRECFRFNTDPCIVYLSLQKLPWRPSKCTEKLSKHSPASTHQHCIRLLTSGLVFKLTKWQLYLWFYDLFLYLNHVS